MIRLQRITTADTDLYSSMEKLMTQSFPSEEYRELEEFYRKYHDKGLEILDIPCNQFAGQTPGTTPR